MKGFPMTKIEADNVENWLQGFFGQGMVRYDKEYYVYINMPFCGEIKIRSLADYLTLWKDLMYIGETQTEENLKDLVKGV